MVSTEMSSDGAGILGFVVLILVEADRERAHRPAAELLHECDHEGRVDAAGQERAERNIRNHAQLHGVSQQLVKLLGRLVGRDAEGAGAGLGLDFDSIPEALAPALHYRTTSRREAHEAG